MRASDSESNDSFGDKSSESYDSEDESCFRGMEVGEIQENDQQYR